MTSGERGFYDRLINKLLMREGLRVLDVGGSERQKNIPNFADLLRSTTTYSSH